MNIKNEFDLITIFASVFSITGAFFLVRSIILAGPKEIAAMAGTYIGSNPHLESSLAKQKADSVVGFALTLLSGICWVLTVFFSYNLQSFSIALLITIGSTATIGIFSHYTSNKINSWMLLKVTAISFSNHVGSYLKPESISDFNAAKLFADVSKYGLDELINSSLDAYENLALIMRFAGASSRADKILELRNQEQSKT